MRHKTALVIFLFYFLFRSPDNSFIITRPVVKDSVVVHVTEEWLESSVVPR